MSAGPGSGPADGMAHERRDLGEILVEQGVITDYHLVAARQQQEDTGRSLGRVLLDSGLVSEQALVAALATQIGLPFVDLATYPIDLTAISLIPRSLVLRYMALPIGFEGGKLVVAMTDPGNQFALDAIRTLTDREIAPMVATRSDLVETIKRVSQDNEIGDIAVAATTEDNGAEPRADETPIAKLVNLLISQAVTDLASDIHIEPQEREVRVRYRIDGVLHEVMRSPKTILSGVIARLKLLADLDVSERRLPQDGRVGLVVGGRAVDLRVATLPTLHGEKATIRILDKSHSFMSLDALAFTDENAARYLAAYTKPYGLILIAGPTGSGKTTTLYATLEALNSLNRNIVTVEDPVEYRLGGISQVQVNSRGGLPFPDALRSVLRSDPDVVVIGEIRDQESARIAVEASMTGHLVLSTIQANDAPAAVTRLTELGIEPYMLASALDAVLGQRLVRRLCETCRTPASVSPEQITAAGLGDDHPVAVFAASGCDRCSATGYSGRLAIQEVMLMSERVENLIVDRRSSEEIGRVATEQGMIRMRADGMRKVLSGRTTIDELSRVVV